MMNISIGGPWGSALGPCLTTYIMTSSGWNSQWALNTWLFSTPNFHNSGLRHMKSRKNTRNSVGDNLRPSAEFQSPSCTSQDQIHNNYQKSTPRPTRYLNQWNSDQRQARPKVHGNSARQKNMLYGTCVIDGG